MKNQLPILALFIIVLVAACSKKDKFPYSTWTVNEENFSTNDVNASIGKAVCILSSKDKYTGFFLSFSASGSFPDQGAYLMKYIPGLESGIVSIVIYYKGISYKPSQTPKTFLVPESNNNKAHYNVKPTWFINNSTGLDSVLVSGKFNEP